MSDEQSSARATACVFAAVACGAVAWAGLSALATPSGYTQKASEVSARVAELERSADTARRPSAHAPEDACPSPDQAGVLGVKQQLAALAGETGVGIADLSAEAPPALTGQGRITPIAVRLQASGPYESVVALLERMGEAHPEVFVESLDLTAAAPKVNLKLIGKVYCWTSARP